MGVCSNGGDGVAEGGQEAIAPPPTSNLHPVPSPRVSYRARNTVGSNYGRGTNVDELSAAEYVVCVCVKRHVCRKRGWRGYILRVRVSRETQRKIGLLFEGQHGGCAEDRFTGQRNFWLLLLLFHTFLYSFCFISSLCPPLFPAPFLFQYPSSLFPSFSLPPPSPSLPPCVFPFIPSLCLSHAHTHGLITLERLSYRRRREHRRKQEMTIIKQS